MKINSRSLILGTHIVIWYIVLITAAAELLEPLKNFLKSLTGHHWVTKSVSAFIIFIICYFIFSNFEETANLKKGVYSVIINTILAALAIFGFFVWHFLYY